MKKITGVKRLTKIGRSVLTGLIISVVCGGWILPASADSWLDSMNEGSGVDRGNALQTREVSVMRASVTENFAASFSASTRIAQVNEKPVIVTLVPAAPPPGLGED